MIAAEDAKIVEQGGKKSDFITRYCYSEEERLTAISELGPDPEITRFKGLGEISPDEFAGFICAYACHTHDYVGQLSGFLRS